ncbi:hypothetical protein UlMin_014209 [Ulmus minor]
MKKLYNKGKVHPSLSTIEDHYLALLPTTILALTAALSAQDKQVLAYLISRSNINNFSNFSGKSKTTQKAKLDDDDHDPAYECDCFRCYLSFWARWDASPNRQIIHEIIEAYEAELDKKKKKKKKGKSANLKKEKRAKSVRDDHQRKFVDLVSEEELMNKDKAEEFVDSNGGCEDGAEEEEVEIGIEKGVVKRFLSFIGESFSGVWSMG